MTVVGLLYKIMFSYSGPLNEVLRAIGLDALAIEWLNSGPSARFVVFLCLVWSNIGWQVLIIFGGLTGIDPVSYTHLDVYKRQVSACVQDCTARRLRTNLPGRLKPEPSDSVSLRSIPSRKFSERPIF